MGNINEPIPYNWTLGWEGCSGEPVVNRLLKAILEQNLNEMDALFSQGATLQACDPTTYKRVLYRVAGNYPVMVCLVQHGLSRVGDDVDYNGDNGANPLKCLSPNGYFWGLIARAYNLGAYDVMELLAQNGFNEFTYYDKGWSEARDADDEILRRGDERGLRILLEHSYDKWDAGPFYRRQYEQYVLNRTQVRRKSIGLDNCKFRNGPTSPRYEEVPLIFGRKEAQARNARRQEDFEDRLRAYQEFKAGFGRKRIDQMNQERREANELLSDAMWSVINSKGL